MKKKAIVVFVLSMMLVLVLSVSAMAADDLSSFPSAVDPQSWEVPEEMTWDAWQDIPTVDWDTLDLPNATLQKGFVVLVDFSDLPFVLTQPKGSDFMGNPQTEPVKEEDLAEFWKEFLNVPSELNNYTSIDDFWRENSYGNWKVEIDVYGPYHLEGMEWEYGIDGFNGAPTDRRDVLAESVALALADENGLKGRMDEYNFGFIIHSGYTESSVWQESGEMKYNSPEEVPDEMGPTEEELESIKVWGAKPLGEAEPIYATDRNGEQYVVNDISWAEGLFEGDNFLQTRYVEWTTWRAAKSVWSYTGNYTAVSGDNSGLEPGTSMRVSVQSEDNGMATFAHEFGHIRSIADNYNNPYGIPDGRTYTGPWELMSRGSFAGPGGTHVRYQIPALEGDVAPAPHMTRLKLKQEFYAEDQYNRLGQDDLLKTGPVFETIVAREVPSTGEYGVGYGVNSLMLDLTEDKTPIVTKDDAGYTWLTSTWGSMSNEKYADKGYYQFYSIEVVQRVGYDSFSSDDGVLISMNREIDNESAPFMWTIDAHPEDIDLVDFTRPNGEKAAVSLGDARQLADALFHAGTGEDVVSEYVDEYNKLHFYVLDKNYDEEGVLSYRVAVRSTEGDPYPRAVTAEAGAVSDAAQGMVAVQEVNVTNTGAHTDLYRLAVESDWETGLTHEVIEVAAGETVTVPVYLKVPATATEAEAYTFTATSEMDEKAVATVTGTVTPTELKVPFTDMAEGAWYYNDVLAAWSDGLVNGRSETSYEPTGNITLAEAVKLAASMNQLYTEGKVSLVNGTDAWYSTYVEYAEEKGIIKSGEYKDLTAMATRAQFATIFAAALPEAALPQINGIGEKEIPDVEMSDRYGEAVLKLYRAGILTGNDEAGTFAPTTNIKRSEVAAIVNRMMNEEIRKTFAL